MIRRLLIAALLAALALPAAAAANGDPPSDILPFEDLSVPAEPPSRASVDGLRGAVRRAREAGYPVKVAVVHSELDLGTLASAFGQPQQYADYLVTELPRHNPDARGARILVVMPAGAAVAGADFGSGERRAARTIEVSTDATPTRLVDAARTTVERMAAEAGRPIGGAGQSSGPAGGAIAAVLIGALLLAGALAGLAARRRRSAAEGSSP